MDLLLEANADCTVKTVTGHCPLHIAVTEKQTEIVNKMRLHNADLNICNDFGETGKTKDFKTLV